MSQQTQHADAWRLRVSCHLDDVRAGLLDLIDIGIHDHLPARRQPTRREIDATDRPDGNFHPTLKSAGRTSGEPSDPTGAATLAWEAAVQSATTRLYGVVAAAVTDVTAALGLTPRGPNGRHLDAPPEPPVRRTLSGAAIVDVSAVTAPDSHAPSCRRAILAGVDYLQAVINGVADRIRNADDPDVADAVDIRAGELEHAVASLARHVAPDRPHPRAGARPTTCACRTLCPDCDEQVCRDHHSGGCMENTDGRTDCSRCRTRMSRHRDRHSQEGAA